MTTNFTSGDSVRIDIPDETDPDHQYHGRHGEIVRVLQDDAGVETGDGRDSTIYRVRLKSEEEIDFRHRDIRPPIE